MQNLKSGLLVFIAVFFIVFIFIYLFGSSIGASITISLFTATLFFLFYLAAMEIMQEWVKSSLTGALMVSLWFAVFINRFKGKKNE